MNHSTISIYQIWDGNTLIMEGPGKTLDERLGLSKGAVNAAYKGGTKLKGRYDVVKATGDEVYRLIDTDGTIICEGQIGDLAKEYGVTTKYLYNKFYSNSLFKKRYKIERAVVKTNRDTLGYLIRHLDEYGNTVMNDDPTPYLGILEARFKTKIKAYKSTFGGWVISL